MKKWTGVFSALFLGLSFSLSAVAKDIEGTNNQKVATSFQTYFSSASAVNWFTRKDLYLAKFNIHDQKWTAYFNKDGRLLLTTRPLRLGELPLALSMELQQKYSGQHVRYITEFCQDGQSTYAITLESPAHWTLLEISHDGQFKTLQKLHKA